MSVNTHKVFSKTAGWYRGDFHAHTTCSDGDLSPRELCELAHGQGLDFLSITDHNAIRAFDDFDGSLDIPVLPGIEVTLKEGHFIVFGFESISEQAPGYFQSLMELPKEIRNHQHRDHATLKDLMARLKEAGLIIDVAHPLLWPWEWRDHDTEIACFDCIELFNDPTYHDSPSANASARRMWSAWLNAGYRITGLGGSDFHRRIPRDDPARAARLNLPLTYVYANELSCGGLLEGVRKGHAYISMGPQIEFNALADGQAYRMGDDLGQVRSTVQLVARVEGCDGPAEAMLIKNGSILTQVPVREGKANITWPVEPHANEKGSWYRLDVIDPEDHGLAISNPIYFGLQPLPGSRPFGSFLGGFTRA